MSEEKDCSSVAGVQAAPDGATDEPHSAGGVGPTPGQIMHRVNAEQFKPNGWVDSYPTWEDYDDAGRAKWEEMARRFTFLSSGVSRSQSEAKPSAGTQAMDDHKYSISPSPLPEGLDLAELKRVAEAASEFTDGLAWRSRYDGCGDAWLEAHDGTEPRTRSETCGRFLADLCGFDPEIKEHIATFDPPTVLSLLLRVETAERPLDLILFCPACGLQHIDKPDERTPDWSNPPHRSHLCHGCGHIWRPADVPTNGVAEIATRGKADSEAVRPEATITRLQAQLETAEREAKENWQKFVDANEARLDAQRERDELELSEAELEQACKDLDLRIESLQADLARAREALGKIAQIKASNGARFVAEAALKGFSQSQPDAQERSPDALHSGGTGVIRHGKWTISPTDSLPPFPSWRMFAWSYIHDDYDGPEDSRYGYAASPEACIEAIEEWVEGHCRCSAPTVSEGE